MKNLDIWVCVFLLLLAASSEAKDLKREADFVDHACVFPYQTDLTLPDRTEVDCEGPRHSIEFDFAPKWYEAVGQSLHYARMTGKRAGIVLIVKSWARDYRHVERARATIDHYGLPITLWVYLDQAVPLHEDFEVFSIQ